MRELLASLIHDNVYLLRHPTIRVIHLARFVPGAMLPQLRACSGIDQRCRSRERGIAPCGLWRQNDGRSPSHTRP